MTDQFIWEEEYQKEIRRAMQARAHGNEGMARVCCRRAAGIVIGEYLLRQGIPELSTSAYNRLAMVGSLSDVDENIKRVCRNLISRVTQEHKLPVNTDLIQDVAWLKETLLASLQDDYANTRHHQ